MRREGVNTFLLMKRTIILLSVVTTIVALVFVASSDAQSDTTSERNAERAAQHEVRQQQRAARLAAYEHYIDSLVLSHNYRFVPQTMQQLPAGMMRNLENPHYEITVWSSAVDVCIPFLKGYTPPYYPVEFNYVLSSV